MGTLKWTYLYGFWTHTNQIYSPSHRPTKLDVTSQKVSFIEPHALATASAVCLRFLVYKEPKINLGSCCRKKKVQFNGKTLRSLANFDSE